MTVTYHAEPEKPKSHYKILTRLARKHGLLVGRCKDGPFLYEKGARSVIVSRDFEALYQLITAWSLTDRKLSFFLFATRKGFKPMVSVE